MSPWRLARRTGWTRPQPRWRVPSRSASTSRRVDGPASAVQRAVETFGGLDAVLVNSGGPPPGAFDALDEATWDRAIQGTLFGAVRLIRAALPHLRHSDRPAILVILSSSAREPIPGLTASNTIRPGLAGLIKSLTRGDRADPDQRPRAWSVLDAAQRGGRGEHRETDRPDDRGGPCRDGRPHPARPSTATLPSSGASGHSSCRLRHRS